MKKTIFIVLALAVVLIAWFFMTKQRVRHNETISQIPKMNLAIASVSQSNITPVIQPIQTNNLLNATSTTNLDQWKVAIKNLKRLNGFTTEQHWLAEQPGRKVGMPVVLSQGGKIVQYSAVLISVTAKNDTGDLIEVDMQTPNMNIDETRKLGLQLCSMLGYDPKEFLAWCDKVGNHWLDAPLYSRGNHYFGFQIIRTYNDEKPWCINFLIMHP